MKGTLTGADAMATNNFTEVSSQSWFSRIAAAIKGIVFGVILFGISFIVLFWNEGRAVKTSQALQEGGRKVITVSAERVEPVNEGKLVHVAGKATTEATLADPVFQVSAKALKLSRRVEMYQWKESSENKTEKKLGGGTDTTTTYTYSKEWSNVTINSAGFKQSADHQNPGAFPYSSEEWMADPVVLGGFTLNRSQVARSGTAATLSIAPATPIPPNLSGPAKVEPTGFYLGKDSAAPQIGDLRVTFHVTQPAEISLIAQQTGASFAPFITKNGRPIDLLQNGTVSPADMLQAAQASNQVLTIILRIVGFFLMFIGLSLVLKPLSVLADVLPILGAIVGIGTGVIAFLVALVLSAATVAVAWILYRPLLAIGLLAIGGGIGYLICQKLQAYRQKK
jgi:hypothetical protein